MKKLVGLILISSILYSCADEVAPIQIANYSNNTLTNKEDKAKTTTTKKQDTSTSKEVKTDETKSNDTKDKINEETKEVEKPKVELSLAQKILLKSKENYDTMQNYSATFTMYSKRNDRTVPNGKPALSTETKYIFQPPRNSSFNVIKHNLSLVIGAKMVWTGGEKAKVKASGVLGLFPLDLSLTDDKMTTNRNWRLDQMDHVGILSRALDDKAQVELIGKVNINNKDAYMIQVKGTGLDEEVTQENIAIDMKDFFIIADEMYSGKDLVFQLKINVEAKNSKLPDNTFTI